MNRILGTVVLVALIGLGGCQRSKLEAALKLAGDNRPELERVLAHYSETPADSLKLRAARFLIENMPGHYSFAGDGIRGYYAKADHLLLDVRFPLEAHRDSLERISREFPGLYTNLVEDIEIITADYLVHNIDLSFRDWTEKRFNRHITFDQFCEYLLPYKVCDLQLLDYWKDSLRGRYSAGYYSRPWPSRTYSTTHAANVINSAINPQVQERAIVSDTYPLLGASNIDRLPFGICDDYSILATAILRSEGIPCFKEDMMWIHKATGHSWHSIINSDGNTMLFKWGLSSSPEQTFFVDEPIAKVQRRMYSHNLRAEEYLKSCTRRAMHPDVFTKDVTSEYIATSTVAVPVDRALFGKDKWAYIAVFHNQKWEPIDFGKVHRGKAVFENMGRNVLYLVFGYDGSRLIPATSPFILHTDGGVEYLNPDHGSLRTVELSRKFPKADHTFLVEQRVVGGRIEAADKADFSDAVPMYELKADDQHKFIEMPLDAEYRYWRYAAAPGSYCDISELEFYLPDSVGPVRTGKIIGTLQTHHANPESTPDKAFDRDWLTNFSCEQADGAWLGLDFGEPVHIARCRCIPRSDDNSIRTGDEYELFYWEQEDWQSLGRQTGRIHVLTYSNVPGGVLLLLKNHTRGTQEQIFTVENGEQMWW